MTDSQSRFEQLIDHLHDFTGLDITLESNSCTLVDNNGEEKIVLELPEKSDLLLFHRMIARLPSDPDTRNGRALQLLELNSHPEILRGAWLCIDNEAIAIHLMLGHPLENLTNDSFENLIVNYIELADTLARELQEEEQELAQSPSSDMNTVRIQI